MYRVTDHKDYDTKIIASNANPEFQDEHTWTLTGGNALHEYLTTEVNLGLKVFIYIFPWISVDSFPHLWRRLSRRSKCAHRICGRTTTAAQPRQARSRWIPVNYGKFYSHIFLIKFFICNFLIRTTPRRTLDPLMYRYSGKIRTFRHVTRSLLPDRLKTF
jgi:hypothetical protein